jgi:hypothetical protein
MFIEKPFDNEEKLHDKKTRDCRVIYVEMAFMSLLLSHFCICHFRHR